MSSRSSRLKRGYPIPTGDIAPAKPADVDFTDTPAEVAGQVKRREALAVMAEQTALLVRLDFLADALTISDALNTMLNRPAPRI